jgi:hypothetical protein
VTAITTDDWRFVSSTKENKPSEKQLRQLELRRDFYRLWNLWLVEERMELKINI